ncbi:sensor histidine kinase [Sphingomonas cavernae]|uniref:Sensor histidine kinase n=1 Tax=Sphingomonas cavernae TaxID=2320861 RepID=A0A418W8A9_9SPHN|nr:histidine kinase [Sphingomonas cavernae]RJF86241.1 sensor histidine kinase [Sphingomonas cavernae]
MARIGLIEKPFFDDKNRAFWNLQSGGWAGYLMLRAISGFSNGFPLEFLVPLLIHVVTGYSLTLILAVIYRLVINQARIVTWGVSVSAVLVATLLYATIDAWVFSTINRPTTPFGTNVIIGMLFLDLTILAAWSSLYYAINFYLIVEEQADQLVKLDSQASAAQLAMLRYQLNPHFLFNTLNSISTLVLLKQTERANAMLSRLSSFLRYTLANEPTAQVTIAQEVETLKLYLEIEKMRFEDRLRTHFTVDERVSKARLPSLLLQPLVENAIKYAVTPQEEGADISVDARLAGDRVQITVSDTGPGLNGAVLRPSYSTGVGLANIRDRLAQAFGPEHRFDAGSKPTGGFSVVIEFPLLLEEQPKVAA